MKKLIIAFFFLFLIPLGAISQPVFYTQDFETYDSLTLPPGWSKWNMRPFYTNPLWNWTVRDSGVCVPGINCARTSKAYHGKKSIMVSWWTANDTTNVSDTLTDAWLVTKQFRNLPSDALLTFYASGGSPSYSDSMQIWLGTSDSLPSHFTTKLMTLIFPVGSIYGNYQQTLIDLSSYAGQNVRIGFRYYMDVTVNGFVVYLDYLQMYGTIGIKNINSEIPTKFALAQNYPNPFNPVTKIKFDLAKSTNVKLEVYNNMGQLIKTVYSGYQNAGYYESEFAAINMASGVYYYRLTTDYYTETKK